MDTELIVLGQRITVSSLEKEVARQIEGKDLVQFLLGVIREGQTDQFRDVVTILEIINTPSNFHSDQLDTLKRACEKYTLTWWLKQTNRTLIREAIIEYWDFFMEMAGELGFIPASGKINDKGNTTNLWKACGDLYHKMHVAYEGHSSEFERLPGGEVNTGELIARALRTTRSPKSFIQLLVGDTIENMPDWFLAIFSRYDDRQNREGCIATLMIAIQS